MTDYGKGGAAKYRVKIDTSKLDIKITHASEVIEMGEAPGQAIRKKKKSSIVLAVDAVAQGSSDAVVAAGSTGAAMASSLFGLGRIPGIDRPAIAVTLPTIKTLMCQAYEMHVCDLVQRIRITLYTSDVQEVPLEAFPLQRTR